MLNEPEQQPTRQEQNWLRKQKKNVSRTEVEVTIDPSERLASDFNLARHDQQTRANFYGTSFPSTCTYGPGKVKAHKMWRGHQLSVVFVVYLVQSVTTAILSFQQERQDKVQISLAELIERSHTEMIKKHDLPKGGSQQKLQLEEQQEACLERVT